MPPLLVTLQAKPVTLQAKPGNHLRLEKSTPERQHFRSDLLSSIRHVRYYPYCREYARIQHHRLTKSARTAPDMHNLPGCILLKLIPNQSLSDACWTLGRVAIWVNTWSFLSLFGDDLVRLPLWIACHDESRELRFGFVG